MSRRPIDPSRLSPAKRRAFYVAEYLACGLNLREARDLYESTLAMERSIRDLAREYGAIVEERS